MSNRATIAIGLLPTGRVSPYPIIDGIASALNENDMDLCVSVLDETKANRHNAHIENRIRATAIGAYKMLQAQGGALVGMHVMLVTSLSRPASMLIAAAGIKGNIAGLFLRIDDRLPFSEFLKDHVTDICRNVCDDAPYLRGACTRDEQTYTAHLVDMVSLSIFRASAAIDFTNTGAYRLQ